MKKVKTLAKLLVYFTTGVVQLVQNCLQAGNLQLYPFRQK